MTARKIYNTVNEVFTARVIDSKSMKDEHFT